MKTSEVRKQFIKAAKQAVSGLKDSTVMVGIMGGDENAERWEFLVQIGWCLMHDKPLVLLVPNTMVVPEKLRAAATIIETYRDGDLNSIKLATKRALTALDIESIH